MESDYTVKREENTKQYQPDNNGRYEYEYCKKRSSQDSLYKRKLNVQHTKTCYKFQNILHSLDI